MRIIQFLFIPLVTFSCSEVKYDFDDFTPIYDTGTDNAGDLIEQISDAKIYFGHQSVGRNILAGLEAWQDATGTSLAIVESRDFSTVPESAFVHFAVGQNGDPSGKVDDFVSLMETVSVEEHPLAFFKFCYVDFNPETDVKGVYEYYKKNMLELKDRFPHIRFLASTVPYTGVQTGLKGRVKKILGRAPNGALENGKRKEFNDMILNDLASTFPVFDLAAAESTRPDGSIETFRYKGKEYPCLPSFYRSDMGHLNEEGARIVSFNLLAFLAEEIKSPKL